jgi:integrase
MQALGQPSSRKTFSDLADAFFREWEGKDAMLPVRVKWWVDRVGSTRLSDITDHVIVALLDAFSRGRAAAPTLFRFAVRQKWVKANPCANVSHTRGQSKRVRWLDENERERLLDACRAPASERLFLLVPLALTTGARQGELLKLRWCDVDLKKREAICLGSWCRALYFTGFSQNNPHPVCRIPPPFLPALASPHYPWMPSNRP